MTTLHPDPDCPTCEGFGWVRRNVELDDPDFGKALPCRCCGGERTQSYVNTETGETYEDAPF